MESGLLMGPRPTPEAIQYKYINILLNKYFKNKIFYHLKNTNEYQWKSKNLYAKNSIKWNFYIPAYLF
jgi:hypothetical protein